VWRHRYVRVEYVDTEGNDRRLEASGFIAAMLQHEIDHLHAKLFIDHVKPGTHNPYSPPPLSLLEEEEEDGLTLLMLLMLLRRGPLLPRRVHAAWRG